MASRLLTANEKTPVHNRGLSLRSDVMRLSRQTDRKKWDSCQRAGINLCSAMRAAAIGRMLAEDSYVPLVDRRSRGIIRSCVDGCLD